MYEIKDMVHTKTQGKLLKEGRVFFQGKKGPKLVEKEEKETISGRKWVAQGGGGGDGVNRDHHCDRWLWATRWQSLLTSLLARGGASPTEVVGVATRQAGSGSRHISSFFYFLYFVSPIRQSHPKICLKSFGVGNKYLSLSSVYLNLCASSRKINI